MKNLYKIFFTTIILFVLIFATNNVYANGFSFDDIKGDADAFINNGNGNGKIKMDEVNESPEEVIVRLKPSKYTFTVRSDGRGCNGEVKTGDNYYDPWLDVCRKEFEYRLMKKN